MTEDDSHPPLHHPHDDVPRGGPWVRVILVSVGLVGAVAIAPESWEIPLGALSILTLLIGVGMLMRGAKE